MMMHHLLLIIFCIIVLHHVLLSMLICAEPPTYTVLSDYSGGPSTSHRTFHIIQVLVASDVISHRLLDVSD